MKSSVNQHELLVKKGFGCRVYAHHTAAGTCGVSCHPGRCMRRISPSLLRLVTGVVSTRTESAASLLPAPSLAVAPECFDGVARGNRPASPSDRQNLRMGRVFRGSPQLLVVSKGHQEESRGHVRGDKETQPNAMPIPRPIRCQCQEARLLAPLGRFRLACWSDR